MASGELYTSVPGPRRWQPEDRKQRWIASAMPTRTAASSAYISTRTCMGASLERWLRRGPAESTPIAWHSWADRARTGYSISVRRPR